MQSIYKKKNEVFIRALIEYNVLFDSSLNLGSVAYTWNVKLQWILKCCTAKKNGRLNQYCNMSFRKVDCQIQRELLAGGDFSVCET